MPFVLDNTGLQIETQKEIKDFWVGKAKAPELWGPSVRADDPSTRLGQFINVIAEREAYLQQVLAGIYALLDASTLEGDALRIYASNQGVEPFTDRKSRSNGFLTTHIQFTVPALTNRIRNNRTGDLWTIKLPNFFVGNTTTRTTLEAIEPGPKEFKASDTWTIVSGLSPVPTNFRADRDIYVGEIGKSEETDLELAERVEAERVSKGNDFYSMIGAVKRVTGGFVGGLENTTDAPIAGVPARAFEIVVDGGDADQIRKAIFSAKPPGAESFGYISGIITAPNGKPETVRYSVATDYNYRLRISVKKLPQVALPFNLQNVLMQAALKHGALRSIPGAAIVPDGFEKALWTATNLPGDVPTLAKIDVYTTSEVGLNPDPTFISHRERPVLKAENVFIEIIGV